MFVTSSHPICKDLCAALGLDPSIISSFTLEFNADDVAYMTIRRYLKDIEISELTAIFQRHRVEADTEYFPLTTKETQDVQPKPPA